MFTEPIHEKMIWAANIEISILVVFRVERQKPGIKRLLWNFLSNDIKNFRPINIKFRHK